MRWATWAVAAEGVFLVLWLLAEAIARSPGDSVSQLVTAAPIAVTAAFAAHGLALLALGLHLWTYGPSFLSLRIAAWAVYVAAAGMVLATVFPAGQTLHVVGASAAFGGVAVAAGATVRVLRWRWLAGAVVACFVLLAVSFPLGWFPVVERVQFVLNGAWLVAVASPRAFSTPARSARP